MSVQIITIAMQRAIPTKMSPSLNSCRSGKNAHAKPSMSKGAKTQLTKREKAKWYQIALPVKRRKSALGETRQRIGHIMRMRAMAA